MSLHFGSLRQLKSAPFYNVDPIMMTVKFVQKSQYIYELVKLLGYTKV